MFYYTTIFFVINLLLGSFSEHIAWNGTEDRGVSSTDCPPQWFKWGEHCYIAIGVSDFSGAILYCESMRDVAPNSRLTSIHSEEENDVVAGIAPYYYLWIGIERTGDQEFGWVDNSPVVYTKWNTGEPDFTDNCTELMTQPLGHWWQTSRCSNQQFFVCKADLNGTILTTPAESQSTLGTTSTSRLTTTELPLTTTTSVTSREVPHYNIVLLGNFTSSSGLPFDASCSSAYSQSLGVRTEGMRRAVNDLLGVTLCSSRVEGELILSSLVSTLTTNNTLGIVKISYYAEAVAHLSFDEVIACSQEISTYLLDHTNWGYPILNGEPGCPFPEFHPTFFDGGQLWHCQLTQQDDAVRADPLPEYEVNVKSNFRTQTGETISTVCIYQYSDDMHSKALSMVTTLNSMLGSTLCTNLGNIEVLTARTYFYVQSSLGDTTVIFSLASMNSALRFNEMMSCADEVEVFLRDHNNWGAPLLPQAPGCPFLVFDPAVFYPQGQSWYC